MGKLKSGLRKRIIEILENSKFPINKKQVAVSLGIHYHTADRHLTYLEIKGLIKSVRIGSSICFYIEKKK